MRVHMLEDRNGYGSQAKACAYLDKSKQLKPIPESDVWDCGTRTTEIGSRGDENLTHTLHYKYDTVAELYAVYQKQNPTDKLSLGKFRQVSAVTVVAVAVVVGSGSCISPSQRLIVSAGLAIFRQRRRPKRVRVFNLHQADLES